MCSQYTCVCAHVCYVFRGVPAPRLFKRTPMSIVLNCWFMELSLSFVSMLHGTPISLHAIETVIKRGVTFVISVTLRTCLLTNRSYIWDSAVWASICHACLNCHRFVFGLDYVSSDHTVLGASGHSGAASVCRPQPNLQQILPWFSCCALIGSFIKSWCLIVRRTSLSRPQMVGMRRQ
jgi:hypothetical protein